MKCPQLTVIDDIAIEPDFAKPEVNWDRLRLWYTGLPSATDRASHDPTILTIKSSSMSADLPNGFCLINIPEACSVETDGVKVPKYAALSYVWDKSDEEIMTTTENFECLKILGRFLENDAPILFWDTFKVCPQLGMDHFWIDRIRVVQNDETRKSAQLEAMGRIYSKANFTIVSSE
ncbi:hypothetical protein NW768_002764 [Fusarium equiseti]|uniref:Heterokaryon incompatibility domain-containing protein n=1 Tax=Fusarium equiseti TaxID=61235 RepID=A0ABQ8RK19_FUSEQ|nr:hypothetical protein NW768_002764 [Fusarium equiseti]